ncbi:hypothetical protein [Priestia megaterium]|uniref:hypothetical protein n=1 Tax=Priestia megaterium TaxID=1404 RepID=UPI002E1EF6BF|nr:hypothetical protein [Priestia megaterium]
MENARISGWELHVYEGLKIIPFTLHFPFQVVIPASLLAIAFLRNRKNTVCPYEKYPKKFLVCPFLYWI